MENNAEIRQMMETYRGILVVINWIGSIIGVIAGFVLLGVIGGYAAIIIIIAIIIGIIGHFFINVGLAIPFILLNNGDILESIKKNIVDDASSNTSSVEIKNCPFCAEKIKDKAKICPHCNKNIEEYENELKIKEEETKKRKEQEMKEKLKKIDHLFNDEDIKKMDIDEKEYYAKNLRRQFDEALDETEKKFLAKQLTALGYEYYRKFS